MNDEQLKEIEADRDRWREDSMRQAETIKRMAEAAEDRNKVDAIRAKIHEAELVALKSEAERIMGELIRRSEDGGKG